MTSIPLRLECAHCNWATRWNDKYINAGWQRLYCHHCKNYFWTKITINDIKIQIRKEPITSYNE